MFEIPDETQLNGTVLQVVQPGYTIGERVLRPAMVGVSKGGPARPPVEAESPAEQTAAPGPEPARPQGDPNKPRVDNGPEQPRKPKETGRNGPVFVSRR